MVDFLDLFVFGFEEIGVGLLEVFDRLFELFLGCCDDALFLEDHLGDFEAGFGEEFVDFMGFLGRAGVAAGG